MCTIDIFDEYLKIVHSSKVHLQPFSLFSNNLKVNGEDYNFKSKLQMFTTLKVTDMRIERTSTKFFMD